MQNCPIVLLNVVGTCRKDNITNSLTNDDQTASAIQLVSSLYENISREISLVVICLYLYQKECLQKEFEILGWNVLVVSVDGFQAQEADVIILLTTRSSNRVGGLGESSEFLRDECRATVALSRAKHGLFVVGDMETLKGGRVWSRFIDRASDFTQIVGSEYLRVLKSGSCKRDRFGQLLSSTGKMVADFVDEYPPQQQASSSDFGRSSGPSTNSAISSRNMNVRVDDWFERDIRENINTNPLNLRKRPANDSWRQWSNTTFVRSDEQTKCYNCSRYGQFAHECNWRQTDTWRKNKSWRGGRGGRY